MEGLQAGRTSTSKRTEGLPLRRSTHGYRNYSAAPPFKVYPCDNVTAETKRNVSVTSFAGVGNAEADLLHAINKTFVSAALEAPHEVWQHYRSGVIPASACSSPPKLNHGILLVGFTPGAFIVKNSWGLLWGERGYMRLQRNASLPTGPCGVSEQPVFPNWGPAPP